MFKDQHTFGNPQYPAEQLSQHTLLGSTQPNALRRQSFMSEPPIGLGIENVSVNTEDLRFNRGMGKNSFNSSTNQNEHTSDTLYQQSGAFNYSGSDKTKRKSISQSPRSNLSFDNKGIIQYNTARLDEISLRVSSLENTVNKLIGLVAEKNNINLENGNKFPLKNVFNNTNIGVSDNQTELGVGEKHEDISPITTTVENPLTQEPKIFKLDPKKIVKKRNKSKSNSAVSSNTKLNKLPYTEQEVGAQINTGPNNKFSIPNFLDQNPSNFNSITGTSFFSNLPLLENNGRKRNSSLGLQLPLNVSNPSILPNFNHQQSLMGSQLDKKSLQQFQPSTTSNAPIQQSLDNKDGNKANIMIPPVNRSLGLPVFSPRSGLPGSIDSISSARTSFDEKQWQLYQQLQKLNQPQMQPPLNNSFQGKIEGVLPNPAYPLEPVMGSESSNSVSSPVFNDRKNSSTVSKKMIDIEKSNSDSDASVHVLSQTPDVSQLLNNTGRLKPHTVSKSNPKSKPKFQYTINRAPSNIAQVWKEYRYGIDGKPPLMELDQKFGNYWLENKSRKTYSRRKVIYEYILRGINEGFPEPMLINQLEELRFYTTDDGKESKKGVGWIQDKLINIHSALGYAKLDNIIRSGALKHIIHDDDQMKVLLSNDSFTDNR